MLPHTKLVVEQVSAQWVMDAHRVDLAVGACQEDVAPSMAGGEPGSEADVAPPPTKPNVA